MGFFFFGGGGVGGGGGERVGATFRLSEFRLIFNLFCFYVEETSIISKLKFASFSPSILILSEMYAFLKTFSITEVNNLGGRGPPCLTPLFIGNLSDTNLSKWILAVAWLQMFCKIFMYVSFMLLFLKASRMANCSSVSKAFS